MRLPKVAIALLAYAGTAAHAQEGIYVGLGVGSFDYEEQIVDPLYGQVSDSAAMKKIIAGFEFNRNVGIEFGYGETGDLTATGQVDHPVFGVVTGNLRTDLKITSLKLLGQWPLDWGVVLGGIGYFTSDNEVVDRQSAACCQANSNFTVTDTGLFAMVGFEYRWGRFGTRWGARLEYEHFDIEDLDTSNIGIALTYGF